MNTNQHIQARPAPDFATETAVMQSLSELSDYVKAYMEGNGGGPCTLEGFSTTLNEFLAYRDDKEAGAPERLEGWLKQHESFRGVEDNVWVRADNQILADYLNKDTSGNVGRYELVDAVYEPGLTGQVTIRGTENGRNKYFVAFNGTNKYEWIMNGEGMYKTVTSRQRDAANYFDSIAERFGITKEDDVYVTGHSNGGNKAQYTTIAADHADLIDHCVALDGDGFSPEAVETFKKALGPAYDERINKIVMVAGNNDFVHVLGVRVVKDENLYYVDTGFGDISAATPEDLNYLASLSIDELIEFAKDPENSPHMAHLSDALKNSLKTMNFDELASGFYNLHRHNYLFERVEQDGELVFTSNLCHSTTQGNFSAFVQDINNYLMSLPPSDRVGAATLIMSLMGGSTDGNYLTPADLVSGVHELYELLRERSSFDEGGGLILTLLNRLSGIINVAQRLYEEDLAQRQAKAAAKAQDMALADPYIHLDTDEMDAIANIMDGLAKRINAFVDETEQIEKTIKGVYEDVDNVMKDVDRLTNDIEHARNDVAEDLKKAEEDLKSGNLIGLAIDGFSAGLDLTKGALNLLGNLFNTAKSFGKSLVSGCKKLLGLLNFYQSPKMKYLAPAAQRMRNMSEYLQSTAQDFSLTEKGNATRGSWGDE